MSTRRMLSRRQVLELTTLATTGMASASLGNAPSTFAASLVAQDSTPADSVPTSGGVFNYAEAGAFNDFNPWTVSATNLGIYNQVFSRLLWKDGDGEIHPDIAESWQMADDGLSFTLNLRQDVRWHDGQECTANDFVTMFEYTEDDELIQHNGVAKIQTLAAPITEILAVDDYTLEFRFEAPVPYITDILDYWFAVRIDDKSDPEMMQTLPIGTGPFTMAEWEPNQYVRLPKFDDFYRNDLPRVDEIMFRRLESAETLVPNLQSGTTSGIMVTSPGDVDPLLESDEYWVEIVESAGSVFNIIVNVEKPPFDQKEVRQALSYSLNREAMAATAFFGVSTPIVSPFFDPASLGYREDLVLAHPFDLDKAASMLEQAGASGLEMTINVTPRWPQMQLFSLIWQSDLQQIGVTLNVNEVEIAQFYDIGGASDLLGNDVHPWLNGRTTRDPAIFWSTQWNYRGGETNRYGFRNEELEELVAQGAGELDEEKRREIYQRLNEIVVDSCHMIQVATDPRIWAFSDAVNDVHFDLNGNIFADSTWIDQS